MKLVITNKLFSIGGGSKVTSEDGKEVYKIKGKLFSPTHKKKMYDLQGNLLYVIRNKWFNWFGHTTYIFNADGEKIGYIHKNKLSMGNSFDLEGFEDDMKLEGKIFNRTLTIIKNDKPAGTITREWTFGIDKFTLDTEHVDKAQLYVAVVVALDNLVDKKMKELSEN